MDKPPGISSVIMIASLDPVSLELQPQAASRFSKRPFAHHEQMPSVNVSWGVCDESALPHMLILSEKQLHRVLHASVTYFNEARPHQGIHQQVPQGEVTSVPPDQRSDRIISVPVLGGLHHEYRRVA
jgi:hypothetical protein